MRSFCFDDRVCPSIVMRRRGGAGGKGTEQTKDTELVVVVRVLSRVHGVQNSHLFVDYSGFCFF